jgi:hypothetical protein
MFEPNNIRPEDWVRKTYGYAAVDLAKLFGIRYIGAQASGLITIAATTNDITLSHGVLASEAADTTVGVAGVFDISGAAYSTIFEVITAINLSPNWEAWPIDFLPTTNMEYGAGTGIILAAGIAAQQCKTAAGITIAVDTSLIVAEVMPVGITFCGPSSKPHNVDAQVCHEILSITSDINFSTTPAIKVYEVDDLLGTATLIDTKNPTDDTLTTWSNYGEPLYQAIGKRLVVQAEDPAAFTDASLLVAARSYPFGPVVRKKNLLSEY